MAERGTPEHTLRMLNDDDYPTAYERVMLCKVQPEPYMVRQVENLLAMLDYARRERSQNQALQEEVERLKGGVTIHLSTGKPLWVSAKDVEEMGFELPALQERIEGALRYLDKCQRDGREIGGRPLRNLLSPAQETDPE